MELTGPKHAYPAYGALVISLDFGLHWGVRDKMAVNGPYRANLLGARKAVPRMLDLFGEFDVGVTWATVGFLFARDRADLMASSPWVFPRYENLALDAYGEEPGNDEREDPLHYAPSLIQKILRHPRQEIGTHTFSHYYCQEEGHTVEAFRADLQSAMAIAKRYGVHPRSIVFPRNQFAADTVAVLRECGITSYRGTEPHSMYAGSAVSEQRTPWRRVSRLADNYLNLSGANVTRWEDIEQPNGLCNIPSSRFLRPYMSKLAVLEPARLRRIMSAMETAARERGIFHLNWHTHNFGVNLEQNLGILRRLLEGYARCRKEFGMRALAMKEVVEALKGKMVHGEVAAWRSGT